MIGSSCAVCWEFPCECADGEIPTLRRRAREAEARVVELEKVLAKVMLARDSHELELRMNGLWPYAARHPHYEGSTKL